MTPREKKEAGRARREAKARARIELQRARERAAAAASWLRALGFTSPICWGHGAVLLSPEESMAIANELMSARGITLNLDRTAFSNRQESGSGERPASTEQQGEPG